MTIERLIELRDYHLSEAVAFRHQDNETKRAKSVWHLAMADDLTALIDALTTHLPALTRAFGSAD